MTIIDSEKLNRAAEKIATLEPCPVKGVVTADQVKIALGELLDVWPNSIADECESARVLPFKSAIIEA